MTIWSLSELEKSNYLSVLKAKQEREVGKLAVINMKGKKQADFSGPFQVLLLQRFWPKKPQAHCFEFPQDKGCSTEGSWEWLGPEVVVRTLTFSDSEAMSRQTVGLWLLAKQ